MKKKFDMTAIADFISKQSIETRVYIGADSFRFKQNREWFAEYTTVIVVHLDGCHGCKLFGETSVERDYDQKRNKPINRLMQEVYKVSELYLKLSPLIGDREIEVHLDINPDEAHGSSCAVTQAIGYIKGTCNVTPLVKPEAFAASFSADRFNSLNIKVA